MAGIFYAKVGFERTVQLRLRDFPRPLLNFSGRDHFFTDFEVGDYMPH